MVLSSVRCPPRFLPHHVRRDGKRDQVDQWPQPPPAEREDCEAVRADVHLFNQPTAPIARRDCTRFANTRLTSRLGIEVARTVSLNYSNQETSFTVGESVRDEDVFIVQSTATGDVNEGLMELLIMISACRTARYGNAQHHSVCVCWLLTLATYAARGG